MRAPRLLLPTFLIWQVDVRAPRLLLSPRLTTERGRDDNASLHPVLALDMGRLSVVLPGAARAPRPAGPAAAPHAAHAPHGGYETYEARACGLQARRDHISETISPRSYLRDHISELQARRDRGLARPLGEVDLASRRGGLSLSARWT